MIPLQLDPNQKQIFRHGDNAGMNRSGSRQMALLQALALMLTLAFVSASAHAHTPVNPGANAAHGTTFNQHPLALDCDSLPGGGHRLHCHLTSRGAEATGPVPPLDDDQPALVARTTILPTRNADMDSAVAVIRTPIFGPPLFILFGNFRS
jgi:hypothetical protein